jgi:hypothetical protein
MKATIFLSALFSFCISTVSGQDDPHEFGKLSQKEFDMTQYDKDPEAEAVVLFDTGLSEFIEEDHSYIIRFTRTRRIKIFSQAGVDFAEVSISFYQEGYGKTERVKAIEAYSYNYENMTLNKKAVDVSNVFEEAINENIKVKKFVIPDVKEGTIVEYKYVLETPFHFNLPDWTFQDKIPTVYSRYTVKMIPFYEYVFLAQRTGGFSYQKSEADKGLSRRFAGIEFNDMVHTYVMKDVPAMKDESYMTSTQDYIMKMDFQLAKFTNIDGSQRSIISTWEELNKSMLKHSEFGKYIKKNQKLAGDILVNELDVQNLGDLEKTKAIVDYVKKTLRWDGFNSKYASKTAKELLREKTGHSADINLFLISMLEAAGIVAEPVLISTRSHGKIKSDYPFSHFFNNVIVLVRIGDKSFVTDGTEPQISFNRIPPRCINEAGLVVRDQEVGWVNLTSEVISSNTIDIEMDVDPAAQMATSKVLTTFTEFESLEAKEDYENDSTQLAKYLSDNGFTNISRVRFVNYDNTERPYIIAFLGDHPVEIIDEKIVVYPFINFPPKENKLTQASRSYPVDFVYPKTVALKSKITLPEGYEIVDYPDKINIDNEQATVSLSYSLVDHTVQFDGIYAFKKSVYVPNEYARIKFYLDNIVKIFNSPLVMEKVKSEVE